MSETIFEGTTIPEVTPAISSSPQLEIPTELSELVGDGKKYKSVEDALKSVPHSQKHIQTLETEAAQMKAELEKRRTAEELLEEIKNGLNQGDVKPTEAKFDPNMIEQTVATLLARKEAASTAKTNVDKVITTFTETFGDKSKAEEVFLKIAEENGMSIQMLNNLAATSPNAVFKLAGMTKKEQGSPSKTVSSVNTNAFPQGNQTELSAKVPKGASTKDLVNAWKIAGEKVKQRNT